MKRFCYAQVEKPNGLLCTAYLDSERTFWCPYSIEEIQLKEDAEIGPILYIPLRKNITKKGACKNFRVADEIRNNLIRKFRKTLKEKVS